jgi:hypothetical protein
MNRSYSRPGVSLLVSPDPPRATAPAQLRALPALPRRVLSDTRAAGCPQRRRRSACRPRAWPGRPAPCADVYYEVKVVCCPSGQRASPFPDKSRREKGPFRGPCCARFPARRSTPPNSRLGLPPYGGGRLLLAAAAALEPLDHGAPWAALFGALLEEATGDRVAYPAAFACASLLSHALKLLQPTCPFNLAARPPHKRPRRTAHRAHRPGRLRCSATRAHAG